MALRVRSSACRTSALDPSDWVRMSIRPKQVAYDWIGERAGRFPACYSVDEAEPLVAVNVQVVHCDGFDGLSPQLAAETCQWVRSSATDWFKGTSVLLIGVPDEELEKPSVDAAPEAMRRGPAVDDFRPPPFGACGGIRHRRAQSKALTGQRRTGGRLIPDAENHGAPRADRFFFDSARTATRASTSSTPRCAWVSRRGSLVMTNRKFAARSLAWISKTT